MRHWMGFSVFVMGWGLLGCSGAQATSPQDPHETEVEKTQPVASSNEVSAAVDLEILPTEIVVGDATIPYEHSPNYRQFKGLVTALAERLGRPAPTQMLPPPPAREDIVPYSIRVHDDARGAEIFSAMRAAAVQGMPGARFAPSGVFAYSKTAPLPSQQAIYLRDINWPERPIQIVVTADGVELWRSELEGSPVRTQAISSSRVEEELPLLLGELCVNGECPPFVVNLQLDGLGLHLNLVLSELAEHLDPKRSEQAAVLLMTGTPANDPLKSRVVRVGATRVNGRLPAQVIRKIVRASFGKFRKCYEEGLKRDENLTGKVAIRFVIGRDGKVPNVGDGGSDIPDSEVVGCVLRGFRELEFPKPEGGIVTVTYPIMFSPG